MSHATDSAATDVSHDDSDITEPGIEARWEVGEHLDGRPGVWAVGCDWLPICRIPGERADALEIAERIVRLHNREIDLAADIATENRIMSRWAAFGAPKDDSQD